MFLMIGPGPNDTFELAPLMKAFSGQSAASDRTDVARKLNALPTSGFSLQASALFIPLLPDANAILSYLARQDPAGYATATYFAFVDAAGENGQGAMFGIGVPGPSSDQLRLAKLRFLKERHIDLTELKRAIRGQGASR